MWRLASGSSPTDILLLRHAQSAWNVEGRWQGRADPGLSSGGHAAAVRAGTLLSPFPAVVSSDLTRARETARLITQAWTCRPVGWVTPLLQERNVGPWQGLTRRQIELRCPGYLARRQCPAVFESDQSALRRLRAALDILHRDFTGQRVLCVTHGGLIHALEAWAEIPRTPLENLAGRWVALRDGVVALGERDSRAM